VGAKRNMDIATQATHDTSDNDTPEALLQEASSLFSVSRKDYRNAMLRVGGLLHRFILARVSEGKGMTNYGRIGKNCCRYRAVEEAAARLDVSKRRICELIHTNRMVELLGNGDPVGNLSWHTLRLFNVFVQRPSVRQGDRDQTKREQWVLRDKIGEKGRDLFLKAVSGEIRQIDLEKMVRELSRGLAAQYGPHVCYYNREKTVRRNAEHKKENSTLDPRKLASLSTPPDLIHLLSDMICSSQDPLSVLSKLESLIPELRTRATMAKLVTVDTSAED
jgi:hypothetical protein